MYARPSSFQRTRPLLLLMNLTPEVGDTEVPAEELPAHHYPDSAYVPATNSQMNVATSFQTDLTSNQLYL